MTLWKKHFHLNIGGEAVIGCCYSLIGDILKNLTWMLYKRLINKPNSQLFIKIKQVVVVKVVAKAWFIERMHCRCAIALSKRKNSNQNARTKQTARDLAADRGVTFYLRDTHRHDLHVPLPCVKHYQTNWRAPLSATHTHTHTHHTLWL